MTYILFSGFLVFWGFSWLRIRKIDKHDGVLFPFCQLRRDITQFLHENVFEKPYPLSPEEDESACHLLQILSATIDNYKQHKTVMFNLRKMAAHLKMYQHTATPALKIPEHAEIREFYERFGQLLVRAFVAYTPLIRWELALRIIVFTYRARMTNNSYLKDVMQQARRVREDAQRHGLLHRSTASMYR